MARLRIVEAAKVVGVSRVTLFRHIKEGKLSRHPDGTIDTSELERAGFTLKHATVTDPVTQQPVATQPETAPLLERIIETLQSERDMLKRQLEQAAERETFLLRLLEQAQLQSQRLLDMPRQTPAEVPRPSPPIAIPDYAARQTIPKSWQVVLAFMQQHPGPQRPQDVQQGLGWPQTARHIMRRMADTGLLRRAQAGVYVVMEDQHHA